MISCPVCNSSDTAHKYHIERYNFDVHECQTCHSQFQHPLPKNANAFYDEGYFTGAASFSYQDERRQEYYHNFVHNARLKSLILYMGPAYSGCDAPFIDVGAAFGALARAAAKYFKSAGLDVSSYAVREGNKASAALKNPARLFQGDLSHLPRTQSAYFQPGSVAAITLIEVGEHLREPRKDLARAFRLLKPGGVLVIQTANFEGWQAVKGGADYHYYLPGHLVYYTATGLKHMLSEIGFREFKDFFPVDFSLWAKWRKAWGEAKGIDTIFRYIRMTFYHVKSKLRWRGRPLTSSYVLYARK